MWLLDRSGSFNVPVLILPIVVLPAGFLLKDLPEWLEFKKKIQIVKTRMEKEELLEKESSEGYKKRGSSLRKSLDKESVRSGSKASKEKIHDQYTGPIFTFTVGTSLVWVIYTLIKGTIKLTSDVIYIQLLLLMSVMILKIIMSAVARFGTPRWLFYGHLIVYFAYLAAVLFIELDEQSSKEEEIVIPDEL